MNPSCIVTSSKDINIRVKLRKQRIVGDYNRRFEKKLLVMPDRCVAYGCSNKAEPENGIDLHKIPFFGDDRKECRRRRKKWIDFVLRRRAHWKPTKHSKICSLHFRREDFSRTFTALPGQEKLSAPRLMADDLGPCVFPENRKHPAMVLRNPAIALCVKIPRKATKMSRTAKGIRRNRAQY